jgi:hypothetical protein
MPCCDLIGADGEFFFINEPMLSKLINLFSFIKIKVVILAYFMSFSFVQILMSLLTFPDEL